MRITISLLFFVLLHPAYSQHANNWFFPERAGITFKNGAPVAAEGGMIATPDPNNMTIRPTESGASISDSKGNLLFYTDGITVWNRNHKPMPNGKGLMGGYSATQPATIVPHPGDPSKYFIFTVDDFQHILLNGFRYSVVDMCLDRGYGDVTSEKNILLTDTVTEKQAITKHANDTDYWVVVHKHFSDAFYAYLVTKDGVQAPVITKIGSVHEGGLFAGTASAIGQMKISPDGSKLAVINTNMPLGNDKAIMDIFSFNTQTGVLFGYTNLTTTLSSVFSGFYGRYGISFSPDSRHFYCGYDGIVQFFYDNNTWNYRDRLFLASSMLNMGRGGMQLAPDGKIYIVKGESFLAALSSPDKLSPDYGFELNAVFLGQQSATFSLPSFYDGFRYTHADPKCPVEPGSGNSGTTGCQSVIYPNPFIDKLSFKSYTAPIREIILYNIQGQLVTTYSNINQLYKQVNLATIANGCYVAHIYYTDGISCINKIVKTGY